MKVVICCAWLIFVAAGTSSAKGWRGLIPLHSTRQDVERLLGVPSDFYYDLRNETVYIDFSSGNCKDGGPDSYKVPVDTVTRIMVIPKLVPGSSTMRATKGKTASTFNCRNANEYSFVVVRNPNRRRDSDPVIPKDLNIVVGDEVISKIELPTDSEVKNFSLNSIEKNKAGFEIKTNWGGSLFHYEIQFNFRCKGNNFYLYKVTKISFSTTNPDSGNFWDKKKSKVTRIQPNLPIGKFVMADYL